MSLEAEVKDRDGNLEKVVFNQGETVFIVGANGTGKTRLAAYIEKQLAEKCHRISAHRALGIELNIAKIPRKNAENSLYFGRENQEEVIYRDGGRWGGKGTSHLLNDYTQLLQLLFAEQNDTALETHNLATIQTVNPGEVTQTRFARLVKVWERLLPHRRLRITGDSISVFADDVDEYSAEDMSDGERAVFYLIGQVLCAPVDSLVVFDEPELHIHRSILSSLWDELEVLRPDCSYLMISHDLEFVATRSGKKYVIEAFKSPNLWSLSEVPDETGFDEELTTLILGSRRPVLFVEGTLDSLDGDIYRNCFPDYLVIPRESCSAVINSVKSFNHNKHLTRIGCAGIIDADDRTEDQKKELEKSRIYALSFSEIENIFLHPDVTATICSMEGYKGAKKQELLTELNDTVFGLATQEEKKKQASMQFVKRRVDIAFKNIDWAGIETLDALDEALQQFGATVNHEVLYTGYCERLEKCIKNRNMAEFLTLYSDKEMLAHAAKILTGKKKNGFCQWVARQLAGKPNSELNKAISKLLPPVKVHDQK